MFDCKLHFIYGIYLLNILFSLAFSRGFYAPMRESRLLSLRNLHQMLGFVKTKTIRQFRHIVENSLIN